MCPSLAQFRFLDEESGTPVEGLVVMLTVVAPIKNDYDVGPKVTDNKGVASFSRQDLVASIRVDQREFPMDYASTLADCESVALNVLSEEEIDRMIGTMAKWGRYIPECRLSDEMLGRLRNSSNSIYDGIAQRFSMEELKDCGEREIVLRRAEAS